VNPSLSRQLFLGFFLIFSLYLNGQNQFRNALGEIEKLSDNEKKIEAYESLLAEVDSEKHTLEEAILCRRIGNAYDEMEDEEKTIEYLLKGIEECRNAKPGDVNLLNEIRYDLAQFYKSTGRMEKQNQLLRSIIDEGDNSVTVCNAHADIGRNMAVRGDYHGGLEYLYTILADTSLINTIDKELIIRIKIVFIYALKYETIFEAEDDNPDLKLVKEQQSEIERKFSESTISEFKYYNTLSNIGTVLGAYQGGLDRALDSYTKCFRFYQSNNDSYEALEALTNIGVMNSKQGNHKKANACYQQVINQSEDIEQIATAYVDMGYFLDTDSSRMKIPYLMKALDIILEKESKGKETFQLPALQNILDSEYNLEILSFLIDLAGILVQTYKESQHEDYLLQAKETIYLIDQLVSYIRLESVSEQSKLFWIENGVDSYMLGVEICYLLNQVDEAFYFLEKNKALLLQENVKLLQEKWELDIPSDILERENRLGYQKHKLYNALLQQPNDLGIKQEYSRLNAKYLEFMDSLELQNAAYSKTKKQIQITDFKNALRDHVNEDRCFIEYILNEKDGYGIFCSAEERLLFKIPDVVELQNELAFLIENLTKPILKKDEMAEYHRIGYSVFKKIFPIPDALEKLKDKRVLLISDQNLIQLPFEALPVDINVELGSSYLVNFCETSYLHSISSFQLIQQKENNPQSSLLAIAPVEFRMDELPALSMSKANMEFLSHFEDSEVLLEDAATKSNFLDYMADYQIIHLNTHAGIDEFNLEPWIAFRDEKLSLNELYGWENQAELVILDACKTNKGKFLSGEGVLNLSRGFFYNGTQSVLASNWNVNEKTGNEIIKTFYNELLKGKSKSGALQEAKIKYLKEHQFSEVLPYYWAAYTLTGNNSPIELNRPNDRLFFGGIFFFAAILLFFYWRFRN